MILLVCDCQDFVVNQSEMRCVKINYLPDLREKYHSRVRFFPLLVFE